MEQKKRNRQKTVRRDGGDTEEEEVEGVKEQRDVTVWEINGQVEVEQ